MGGVVVTILVCTTLLGAGVTVQGSQNGSGISVFAPENRVAPGQETRLQLVVANDGSGTNGGSTLSGATVEVGDANTPITVLSNRVPVGTLPPRNTTVGARSNPSRRAGDGG
ncbi:MULTISPECIES: hypothetical protein [unclassified Haladaptatus]|uniref:hypothetical protein n=1 Tax=unclassified Haladaptatus TaxID=2622732 RepID=UPI00209C09E1|nr:MULTISPECIES: hypothetical protein [unclassified Haladaptatus]MCO8246434.1 hypothetical protein [Haladaptatus sp. AB643]MCO8254671.1 hypothetical protein [Haladaptatus sp. AB618]